ncbi:hypothetical protein PMAYCL1PPCAC_28889, partial [Pristionchus mayeri]
EGNGGGQPVKVSYMERMRKLRAANDAKRAREGYGVNYAISNPSISTTTGTEEEKENGANCSNYDASLLQESQLRANKSAPAGDVSSMGSSMLSTTSIGGGGGDVLQMSSFSLLGDASIAASANASRNTSGGSSVIDVPRDAGGHNSILSSFIKEEQPSKLESFSRPHEPMPRSRVDSEGLERRVEPDETFDIHPPPDRPSLAAQQMLQSDRSGRSAAANGSILRSKSAASAFEPIFATPAVSRSSMILGGLMPRTPGFCQTPSMNRLSMSALSLASAQRMIIKDKEYAILSQIGKGGSSQVFQAFDDLSGETVAIKVVDLSDTDDAAREAFVNEVELLKKLQGSNHVIRMVDYELVPEEDKLLVVMEKGETDLATYLKTRRDEITPIFLRYWWSEMLQAVKFVHEHKVVHMDLKPANFLLVSGNLKLIDFGIASSIPSDKTSLLKDTQMGTLSYMSPESLMSSECEEEGEEEKNRFKVTAKSDVWSLGCILYTMVYGRKPFDQFKNARAKMRAISDPHTQIFYEPTDDPMIVDVLKRCLVYDVKKRASVTELLDHPYLKGSLSACNRNAAAVATPPRISPFTDGDLAQIAHRMQSQTPRTLQRTLKELVIKAQSKGPSTRKKSVLELDSPPSTN